MSALSGFNHRQLYDAVHAADARQVEELAGLYDVLQSEAHALAHELDTGLTALGEVWRGAAGTTYHETVGTITGFAAALGGDLLATRNNLRGLPAAVRQAQREMPDPADTENHDKLIRNAAVGALFGPVAGSVAAVKGYQQDQQEKAAATARAVQVAQRLADAHQAHDFRTVPSAAPAQLPGARGAGGAPAAGTAAGAVGPSVRSGAVGATPHDRTPAATAAAADGHGPDAAGAVGLPVGGGLAAGGAIGGAVGGIGGPGSAAAAVAGSDASGAAGATGAGGNGAGGGPGTAIGVGGAAGMGIAGFGNRRGGGTALEVAAAAGRPLFDGETTRAGVAASAVLDGTEDTRADGTQGTPGQSAPGQGGHGGSGDAGHAASGGTGSPGDGQDRRAPFAPTGGGIGTGHQGAEYDTWLTEDEIVWGGDPEAPPPVLGGRD
jgi:uncharacterized protein YukE